MIRPPSPAYRSLAPAPRPFPTRGVAGGWQDPWDGDPIDAMLAARSDPGAPARSVRAAGLHFELGVRAREDGRWVAHVAAWDGPPDGPSVRWPSVNGPTAAVALDALEAELRDLVAGAGRSAD